MRRGLSVSLAALGLVSPMPALAQVEPQQGIEETDEIVVTATKRAENVQRVPISITALDSTALAERGATKLEDYAHLAPGLVFSSNGGNAGNFSVRGINTSTLAGNTQSPVAIYYDDLPALNSFAPLVTPDLRLYDTKQIEILRGPQGTLFGSGSLGGAIRVISNTPESDRFAVKGEATAALTKSGEESYALSGVVNIPLVEDKAALRAVGYWVRDGGWIDNVRQGRNDANRQKSRGGRIMLSLTPVEGLELLGSISHQDDHPDDASYSLYAGPARQYDALASQYSRQKLTIYNLTANIGTGLGRITSVTTYADQEQSISRDFSRAVAAALGFTDPAPYDAFGPSKSFSQELRIASEGDGPLQWLIGGFYQRNRRTMNERVNVPGAGAVLAPIGFPSDDLFIASSRIRSSEKAVFGEISYDITERLTATAGARAFWNQLHIVNDADGILNGGRAQADRLTKENSITPKFALRYTLDANAIVYVQAAKGYRIGQLNLGPALDPVSGLPIPTSFGPDNLWNYEFGVKSNLLDRRITFNAAGYYIDWKDIQLQSQSAAGYAYIANAGTARSMGIEVETRFNLLPGLEFGASLAVNDSKITAVNPGIAARVGDRLPAAPKFTLSDFAQYRFSLGSSAQGVLRIDHQFMGKAFSNLNNAASPSFGDFHVVNLRAGVELPGFELSAFVNNLGDSNGLQNAVVLPGGRAAVRLRPRTFGITVMVSH